MNTVQVIYTIYIYIIHVRTCKVYNMSLTYCGALQAGIICMYYVTEIEAPPHYIYIPCGCHSVLRASEVLVVSEYSAPS